MSWATAQKQIDKIQTSISRSIVNKNYHQGIITINKKDFENFISNKHEEVFQEPLPGFRVTLIDEWWARLARKLEKGTRSKQFETDFVNDGDVYKVQYAAIDNNTDKATQTNAAEYVKRACRSAAKESRGFIKSQLLNSHAADGGAEQNFPDKPGDHSAIVQEGYNKPHSEDLKRRADKLMSPTATGAQGTVANQRIDLFLKEWEDYLNSNNLGAVFKLQHWFVKNWYDNYFGQKRSFEGNWTDRKIDAGLLIQQTIMPNRLNSGVLDNAIYRMVEKELGKGKKVVEGVLKVTRMLGMGPLLDLFAASPSPKNKVIAISKKVVIDNLFPHKTNPNMRLKVNKDLYKSAKNMKGKKYSKSDPLGTLKGTVVASKAVKKKRSRSSVDAKGRAIGMTAQSPIALRNLLNEALPQMVASKMTQPALQFRTGRFANSVRVENVTQGPRGGIGIDYTYMKDPYETFEPGGKQGSTMRDPRRIIGASIRQLAMGIIGRQPTSIRRN